MAGAAVKPAAKEQHRRKVGDRFRLTEVREDELVCGIEVAPSNLHESETLSTHQITSCDGTYGSSSLSSNSLSSAEAVRNIFV